MGSPVFIGDPVTAAGYRLAGASVRTPGPTGAETALRAAVADAPSFIILTVSYAKNVNEDLLEEVLAAFAPPVLIVPDAPGRTEMPDWGSDIRQRIMAE